MKNKAVKIFFVFILLLTLINTANALQLSSPDFSDNNFIPAKFTCDGGNQPPALHWQAAPKNTQSFALIIADPNAPAGTWYHWLIFNIPAHVTQLTSHDVDLLKKINIGKNSWQHAQYEGPCPPKGQSHRYVFTLYALDILLALPNNVSANDLLLAMQNHVLATANLYGNYQH